MEKDTAPETTSPDTQNADQPWSEGLPLSRFPTVVSSNRAVRKHAGSRYDELHD